MYKTEKFDADKFEPKRFESDHTMTLNGEEISYHTVAEDNVYYDDGGKAIATLFSYSYFRTGVDSTTRPVMFCFNGGPGSASMYVHAGFFGTKRIKYGENVDRATSLPPYEVIDNPDCLLDICDIVIVEPVGTGYGVLFDEKYAKDFYGIEEDAEALLTFIEKWCHKYNRWLSPKYIAGESYGCTRAVTAAGIACGIGKSRGYGLKFDGLVLIGNTVTVGKYFNREVQVEDSVLYFPTFAAINHYHNHPSDQSVEEFVMEAKAFAEHDYLLALFKGESLVGEEREEIIKKISYYTGVSKEYLEARALKLEEDSFRSEVIKHKGLAVSRDDGRITRPLIVPQKVEDKIGPWQEPLSDRYDSFFYAALNGVINPYLNVKLDRQYLTYMMYFNDKHEWGWNEETKGGTTAERLRDAMNSTYGMRTFFANGWYDDCTEIGFVWYTLNHAGLPKDRIYVKGYESGHMIYVSEQNTKVLSQDIRKFISGQDPTK